MSDKKSLALDVEVLRRKLGPVKVALIEQWIREVNGPLDALIAHYSGADCVALDAGCSRGDPDLPALQAAKFCVGCDVDLPGLRANDLADARVLAGLDTLPFAPASFDIVVSKWVLEHLERPEQVFAEWARVLKPGGRLIFLTPNAHSLFTFISRSIPYRLKQVLKGRMFGVHEEDTFRTWYRANTRCELGPMLRAAGFEERVFTLLPGMWTFFIFHAGLARLVRRLELLQQKTPLRGMATYVLAVYEKGSR